MQLLIQLGGRSGGGRLRTDISERDDRDETALDRIVGRVGTVESRVGQEVGFNYRRVEFVHCRDVQVGPSFLYEYARCDQFNN